MKLVKIYRIQDDGSQEVIAVCQMDKDEKTVICKAEIDSEEAKRFVKRLNHEGLVDYNSSSKERRLYPHHGADFLGALKENFNSPYLTATDILEEE